MNKIGQVLSSAPDVLTVTVDGLKVFEDNKESLQIGRYLKIAQGNNDFTLALIRNLKGTTIVADGQNTDWSFIIECQSVGTLTDGNVFERGSTALPVPTEPVYCMDEETLDNLFGSNDEFSFPVGVVSSNKRIPFKINGDKFFGKHIAVVGSTGSGKSCAVARILQDIVGISNSTM